MRYNADTALAPCRNGGWPSVPSRTAGDRHRWAGRYFGPSMGTAMGCRWPQPNRGSPRRCRAVSPISGARGAAIIALIEFTLQRDDEHSVRHGGLARVRRLRLDGEVVARQRGRPRGAAEIRGGQHGQFTARSDSSPGTSVGPSRHRTDVKGAGAREGGRRECPPSPPGWRRAPDRWDWWMAESIGGSSTWWGGATVTGGYGGHDGSDGDGDSGEAHGAVPIWSIEVRPPRPRRSVTCDGVTCGFTCQYAGHRVLLGSDLCISGVSTVAACWRRPWTKNFAEPTARGRRATGSTSTR